MMNGGATSVLLIRIQTRVCLSKRVSPGWSIGRANVVAGTTRSHFGVVSSSSTLETLNKPHAAVFPFEPSLPSRPSVTLLPSPFDPIHHLPSPIRRTSGDGNARITEDLRRNLFLVER